MKKDQLRAEVAATLKGLGFKPKQYRWSGCTLDVVIGGEFRSMRFPAGTSKRALAFEMGRLTGWCEAMNGHTPAEVTPANLAPVKVAAVSKPNGHHKEAAL